MAQAVAEHVQEEQYAEEEGVGGPQALDALQVGIPIVWTGARARRGTGWQRLTPSAPGCPLQELGVPAGDIKKLKEGGAERCPGRGVWPQGAASGGGAAPPLAAAPTRCLRLPAAAQASPPWRASCSPPPRSWAPSRASAKPRSQSSRRWVGALLRSGLVGAGCCRLGQRGARFVTAAAWCLPV